MFEGGRCLPGAPRYDLVVKVLVMQKARRSIPPASNPVSGRSLVSFAVREEVETEVILYNMLGQEGPSYRARLLLF